MLEKGQIVWLKISGERVIIVDIIKPSFFDKKMYYLVENKEYEQRTAEEFEIVTAKSQFTTPKT